MARACSTWAFCSAAPLTTPTCTPPLPCNLQGTGLAQQQLQQQRKPAKGGSKGVTKPLSVTNGRVAKKTANNKWASGKGAKAAAAAALLGEVQLGAAAVVGVGGDGMVMMAPQQAAAAGVAAGGAGAAAGVQMAPVEPQQQQGVQPHAPVQQAAAGQQEQVAAVAAVAAPVQGGRSLRRNVRAPQRLIAQ